jgi:hypothetical protein
MKKLTLTILLTGIALCAFAQTSTSPTDATDSSFVFYISPMGGFYTSPGTFKKRLTPDLEFGLQWDVFSLGVDVGKVNLGQNGGRDSTTYFELRPNLNVFQQGKFTNTLTIGLGFVPHAKENIMTEFTTGIEYTPNPRFSYNLFFGTYYFSGVHSASSVNFFGLSAMYYFIRDKKKKKKGLFNK